METDKTNPTHDILIKKASGDQEHFRVEKLERSLRNAGAENETIQKIIIDISNWIYSGVTTKEIYRRAFTILRRDKRSPAIRYRLKRAILELGPTGYPFENLCGQLFDRLGYKTEVGVVVDGKCVTHEMDVIATQENQQHLVECKYHKDQGKHVSVQVPLYVRSRVNDIIDLRKSMPEFAGLNFTGWVITNTRFSSDSIQYGTCAGLKLLGWDYPEGKGLKEQIEKYKLYPITILSKITLKQKQQLMEEGIVSCPQLLAKQEMLKHLSLTHSKQKALIAELNDVCY